MKYGNIFWGILLITLGALIALKNFGVIHFQWLNFLNLWPFLFIFWGIAVLPVNALVRTILLVVTIVAAILVLVNAPQRHFFTWCDSGGRTFTGHQVEQVSYDTLVQYARLNMDAAAGEFNIGDTTANLFDFSCDGEGNDFRIREIRNDTMATITVSRTKHEFKGKIRCEARVSLNPNPVWRLDLDAGAAKVNLDLTKIRTDRIEIDGGACSLDLKVGNRYPEARIKINSGVSSIRIAVPETSACEIEGSAVLSSRELENFNEISKGHYQTPNFSDTIPKIFISLDVAISSLTVERY